MATLAQLKDLESKIEAVAKELTGLLKEAAVQQMRCDVSLLELQALGGGNYQMVSVICRIRLQEIAMENS